MRIRIAFLAVVAIATTFVVVPERAAEALTTSEIRSKVASLKKTLKVVAEDLDAAESELAYTTAQIATHARALREAEARRGELREALSHRAAQLYVYGTMSDIDILAGDGIGAFIDRIAYLEAMRRGETGLLEEARALQRRSASERELMRAARAKALEVKRHLDSRQSELSSQLSEMERLLNFLGTSTSRQIIGGGSGFICPVVGANVPLSNFGDPRPGGPHAGIDIRANTGQYVRAPLPGTIIEMPTGSWWGYGIIMRDLTGTEWYYAHLSSRSTSVGRRVAAGEVLGRVGCTGYCSGSHLHFEWHPDGGAPRDPYSIVSRAC